MTATYPLFVQQGKLVRDLFDRTQHTHESTAAEHDDLDDVVACIRLDAAIQFAEASAERNLICRLLRHTQSTSSYRLAPLRGPSRARTESMHASASASVSPRPEPRDRQVSTASTVLDTPTDVHAVFEFDTAASTPPLMFDPSSHRSHAPVIGNQTPAVSASASPTRGPLPSQLTSSPLLGSDDFIPSDQAALVATEPEMEMIEVPHEPSRVVRKSQSDPTAAHAAGPSALSTSERAQLLHTTTVDYSNRGSVVHGMPGRHRATRHVSGAHSRSALFRLLTTPLSTAHELASIGQQARRTDVSRSNMAPRRSCPQREGSPEWSPWTSSCDGRMQTDPGLFTISTVSHSVALPDRSADRSQLPQAGASVPASHPAAAGESTRKSRFRQLFRRSKGLFKRGNAINRVLPLSDVPSQSVSANPSTTPRDLQPSNRAHAHAAATCSPIAVLRGSRDTYVPSLYEFAGAKESLLRRLERVQKGIERMIKKSEQQLQSQIVLTSLAHSSVSSAAPQSKESPGSLAADLTQIPRPHSHSMDSGYHASNTRELSTPCDLQRTSSASASVTSPSDDTTPRMSRIEALQQTLPQLTTYLQSLRRYTSSVNLINWKRHRGAANTALLPNDGGSTATVVTVMGNQLHVGNVGDSTCVVGHVPDVDALFRPATAASTISSVTRRSSRRPLEGVHAQAQQQAQQRRRAASNAARAIVADRCSTDHRCGTPAEDARMLQAGASQRSVYYCMPMCENRLMLSRTLGDSPYHRCGAMLAEPCVTSRVVKETDAFMILATDGVWDVMELEEAVTITFDYLMDHNYHRRDAGQIYPPATNSVAPSCDSHSQQSNVTGGSGFVSQVSFQEPVRRHQGPRHYSCDVRQQFDAQLQHQLDKAVCMTTQDASTVDGYVPRDPSVMYGMCVREAAAAVSCNTGRPLSNSRDGSRAPVHRSPVLSSTAAMKGQGGEPLYCAVPQSRGSAILQNCATHLKRVAYRRSQARVAQAGEGRVDDIAVSIITFPAFWEAVRSRERSGSVVSTD